MCACVPLCAILFIFLVVNRFVFANNMLQSSCCHYLLTCMLCMKLIFNEKTYAHISYCLVYMLIYVPWSGCDFFLSVCDYCHGLYAHIWAALDFFGPYVINMEWH